MFGGPWIVLSRHAAQDAGKEMKREDEIDFTEQRLAGFYFWSSR